METTKNLSEVEHIKTKSNFLRGTLKESLIDELTGAISPDDTQLIKFHGSYQQTDRDLDSERKRQKLEPLYSFMIRVRMPGGIANTEQWLAMDKLADQYGSKTIKLTTRQAFQLHGIIKRNLKPTIQAINEACLDTIAACGDVNRNVMVSPNVFISKVFEDAAKMGNLISEHLLPHTTAYHEIWLDKKLLTSGEEDFEPIYGKTYLPRKFKIAICVPPYNDIDAFANDLGLIAIEEKGQLIGFNVAIGGGMGMTFGNAATHPRLADVIGYIPVDKTLELVEHIVGVQRDNGNRSDRKLSRLKYTIEAMTVEGFTNELEKRLGYKLEPQRPYKLISNNDQYGWYQGENKKWHLCLFIEGGRIKDSGDIKLKTALKKIAEGFSPDFILTGNQNLIIANIDEKDKSKVAEILKKYGYDAEQKISGLRQHSLACVALNTCTLAFAEAERYLPFLITKIESIFEAEGLFDYPVNIRMTGCPNGCARPFLAEIGLVGRSLGRYNLYLGASHQGTRLNKLYKEMLNENEILEALQPIIKQFAKEKEKDERLGDFLIRKQVV